MLNILAIPVVIWLSFQPLLYVYKHNNCVHHAVTCKLFLIENTVYAIIVFINTVGTNDEVRDICTCTGVTHTQNFPNLEISTRTTLCPN